MKEILDLYYQNKNHIENFIKETLDTNVESLNHLKNENFNKLFDTFFSLELIYIVDKNSKRQISTNIYKNYKDESTLNESREYLIEKLQALDGETSFTAPYRSAATKSLCITMSRKIGNEIYFLDFDLVSLMQRMELVDVNSFFRQMTKTFYAIAGFSMVILSTFIICYAMYKFVSGFFLADIVSIDSIFRPIISLTLGLAVFDLAKTVLEQEVFFKSYSPNSKFEIRTLTKFLISIIIALSIEALMVVFKIAIEDYDKMLNAFFLISGVSLFIIALSIFVYFTTKKEKIKKID